MRIVLRLLAAALAAVPALAADVAVRGDAVRLRASASNAERRGATVRLVDAVIRAPFARPAHGWRSPDRPRRHVGGGVLRARDAAGRRLARCRR